MIKEVHPGGVSAEGMAGTECGGEGGPCCDPMGGRAGGGQRGPRGHPHVLWAPVSGPRSCRAIRSTALHGGDCSVHLTEEEGGRISGQYGVFGEKLPAQVGGTLIARKCLNLRPQVTGSHGRCLRASCHTKGKPAEIWG